jgi:hypothetical protein
MVVRLPLSSTCDVISVSVKVLDITYYSKISNHVAKKINPYRSSRSAPCIILDKREGRNMVDLLWSGAVALTMTGALFFWGARVFEVESFYIDSSTVLGLALVLVGLAKI